MITMKVDSDDNEDGDCDEGDSGDEAPEYPNDNVTHHYNRDNCYDRDTRYKDAAQRREKWGY